MCHMLFLLAFLCFEGFIEELRIYILNLSFKKVTEDSKSKSSKYVSYKQCKIIITVSTVDPFSNLIFPS